MDINRVLLEYDNMYGVNSLEEIDDFLSGKIEQALDEEDNNSALTLMNEMLGFCRDTSQRKKGLYYCEAVEKMFDKMGLKDTVSYATSMINVANAYRTFGLFDKAKDAFCTVELIYKAKVPAGDFNYASLYNNWSLLYQETGDFQGAKSMLVRALSVIDMQKKAVIPQATTRCNLAVTLFHISDGEKKKGNDDAASEAYDEGMKYLEESLKTFEADGGRDFHYGAALAAMGDAMYLKDNYDEAAEYYERALAEIERHTGKTDAYDRVLDNYNKAAAMARGNEVGDKYEAGVRTDSEIRGNLARCKDFYEKYGAPMIHEKFPEYEERIAVGMVGEGSDCYGFDDEISMDHDYGIGFCLWVTSEDYEKIGISLNREYERLVARHLSEYGDTSYNTMLDNRRGVSSVGRFYEMVLGIRMDENTVKRGGVNVLFDDNTWLSISEDKLACATNGKIFRDDLGIFTAIRNGLLSYYPDRVWRLRLSEKLHDFAQYAQSNYARMMARKDYVSAMLCLADGAKSAMEIAYLLNRTYAPYYKWQYRGLSKLPVLKGIIPLLDRLATVKNQADAWDNKAYSPYEINHDDEAVCLFEQIAVLILEELRLQGIADGDDTFMDIHSRKIAGQAVGHEADRTTSDEIIQSDRIELVDKVVELEWKQFDKVDNLGGRADCQDDWNTFSIMRKSQYLAWDMSLLTSYYNDLLDAESRGWNMITEKYARMMETTAPDEYEELKQGLPAISDERKKITEAIVEIQVAWMEEFADSYPKMAGNARSIHTSSDSVYNTSYETYLRGELGTYSDETLGLYSAFIVSLYRAGENLAYKIMDNTAKLYGYRDAQDAERRMG